MISNLIGNIWLLVLDLLLPAFCLGCGKEGAFLCNTCFSVVPRIEKQVCPGCYTPSDKGLFCGVCRDGRYLDGVLSCCSYTEKSPISYYIHAFKYDFVESLKLPLGGLVAECLEVHNFESGVVLCPVPLHKRRLKWRGFNQSRLIADVAADACKGATVCELLKRVHFKKPQMELKKEDRLANTRNAFEIESESLKNMNTDTVFLVDDVATTLSTVESCAEVLKKNGIKRVFAIVLARVY